VSRQSEEDFKGLLSSGESDIEDDNLCSALVLCGPHGVGKTAMVYAVAKELGFKVSHLLLDHCQILVAIHSLCSDISEYDISVSVSWAIPDTPFIQ